MSAADLDRQVREALDQVAPEAAGRTLDPDLDLRDQIDIDSMDILELAIALSKRFGVDIPEADYPRITTLRGCATYLREATALGNQD